jgi:hypothetical protein
MIRKELDIEVEEQGGAYGEFTVLVDGEPLVRGNPVAVAFAIVPPLDELVVAIRNRMAMKR